MKIRQFNYVQLTVVSGLIVLGVVLLTTDTALIAVIVSTIALMLLLIRFLLGRKSKPSAGPSVKSTRMAKLQNGVNDE